MALTSILLTVVSGPVVVTSTVAVLVTMGIGHAGRTLGTLWAVADFGIRWFTAGIAWSNIVKTVLSVPVLITYTISVIVEVRVLHTELTVTVAWAITAVAFVVTEALVD